MEPNHRDAKLVSITEIRLYKEQEIREKLEGMLAISNDLQRMPLSEDMKRKFLKIDFRIRAVIRQMEEALDQIP